jgi:hypothetical protein
VGGVTALPHDLDAERAVLGALMRGAVVDGLTGTTFYRPAHTLIHEAIEGLAAAGKPADPIAVADEMRRRHTLSRISGAPYLHDCLAAAPAGPQAPHYAGIILELAERRTLIEHASRLHQAALNPGEDMASVRALAAGPGDLRQTDDSGAQVVRLSDVEPERVSWLWDGYLPLGKLVTLDGDPGVGKSTVSADIAARVSTGSPMPDGTAPVKGAVLILSAEDGLADTVRPRLDAAGADPARIITITEIASHSDGRRYSRPVSIPGDLPTIERIIRENYVVLVIIDVLMAFLSGEVNSHRDQDVRRALHVLATTADQCGCCVIVLRHLNKAGGGNALYRGGGSIGIIGAARAGFMCGTDPTDDTGKTRVLAPVKANLAEMPPALAYHLVNDDLHGCASVQWDGISEHAAASLLSEPATEDDRDDRSARDEAAGWLTDYLTDNGGEATPGDAKKAAREAGIAPRTLERARLKARVKIKRSGFPARTVWVLGGTDSPQTRQSRQAPGTGEPGETGGETGHETKSAKGANNARGGHPGTLGTLAWAEGSNGEAAQQ